MRWIRRLGKLVLAVVTAVFCLGIIAAAVFGVKEYHATFLQATGFV